MSLVDIHAQISEQDVELEKQAAAELEKLAEEDAAGRIMARGFWDEMNKIAGPGGFGAQFSQPGGTIKSKNYSTGGPSGPSGAAAPRTIKAPKAEKAKANTGTFSTGKNVSRGGNVGLGMFFNKKRKVTTPSNPNVRTRTLGGQ